MPKVKNLFRRVSTYPFEVKILTISYSERKKDNRNIYFATCTAIELIDGEEKKNKNIFKMNIWLDGNEFKVKPIRQNDIIKLSDHIYWVPKGEYEYRIYDKERLKENKKYIEIDEQGRPYYIEKIYPFVVSVPKGEWKMYDRYSEDFFARLGYDSEHSIYLFFDTREEVMDFCGGDFYIEDNEYETLKDQNKMLVKYVPFVHRIKKPEKWFTIELERDKELQQWILKVKK